MKIVVSERCSFCGKYVDFIIRKEATLLREAQCSNCRASLRSSDLANILLKSVFPQKENLTMDDLVEKKDLKILNLFSEGPVHNSLKNLPNYCCGEFFDDIKSGDYYNGIKCIDLQNIPFEDNTFDLIITEDVLEHVLDIEMAFNEIKRVLKKDGFHIFTIPVHEKNKTVSRKKNDKKVFHGDPLRDKGALVNTDFGNDLIDILKRFGMDTEEYMVHRFFSKEDISYIDEEYDMYLANRMELDRVFRYNSVVYVSRKKDLSFINYLKSLFNRILYFLNKKE